MPYDLPRCVDGHLGGYRGRQQQIVYDLLIRGQFETGDELAFTRGARLHWPQRVDALTTLHRICQAFGNSHLDLAALEALEELAAQVREQIDANQQLHAAQRAAAERVAA